jgi:hypothetical protein
LTGYQASYSFANGATSSSNYTVRLSKTVSESDSSFCNSLHLKPQTKDVTLHAFNYGSNRN